jgi:hypothetical protein
MRRLASAFLLSLVGPSETGGGNDASMMSPLFGHVPDGWVPGCLLVATMVAYIVAGYRAAKAHGSMYAAFERYGTPDEATADSAPWPAPVSP